MTAPRQASRWDYVPDWRWVGEDRVRRTRRAVVPLALVGAVVGVALAVVLLASLGAFDVGSPRRAFLMMFGLAAAGSLVYGALALLMVRRRAVGGNLDRRGGHGLVIAETTLTVLALVSAVATVLLAAGPAVALALPILLAPLLTLALALWTVAAFRDVS